MVQSALRCDGATHITSCIESILACENSLGPIQRIVVQKWSLVAAGPVISVSSSNGELMNVTPSLRAAY
jgi:hypothetical protein